ncbi:hypothetical protein [Williamsia sp.]|uniref:hypothetical protein n=1 Tax=Williamsia sp. TaxID=1872085 RepID=UPI002F92E11E
MAFELNPTIVRELLDIKSLAGPLHALGLLTDEQLAETERLTRIADAAQVAGREFEEERQHKLQKAGRELATSGEITVASLTKVLKDFGPVKDVDTVADEPHRVVRRLHFLGE